MDQKEIKFYDWVKTKSFRYNIIASIVASSLFLIFIDPIISSFWGLILWSSNFIIDSLIDKVYQSAALGHRNHFAYMILVLLTTPVIAFSSIKILQSFPIESRKKQKEITSKTRFDRIKNFLTGALGLVLILILTTFGFADLQYNTSFNQRLTVLHPYLADQEYKKLKSSWAKMETREDYLELNMTIENLAKENKIDLPKQLLR